jgi:hypothetical protein
MAWLLILKILEITDSEEVMAILAAGHLENFLVHHGEEYIKKVEEESRKNPKFKNLLKGVWKNNIKDGVWGRILKSTE